jgi:hypothetical protein
MCLVTFVLRLDRPWRVKEPVWVDTMPRMDNHRGFWEVSLLDEGQSLFDGAWKGALMGLPVQVDVRPQARDGHDLGRLGPLLVGSPLGSGRTQSDTQAEVADLTKPAEVRGKICGAKDAKPGLVRPLPCESGDA